MKNSVFRNFQKDGQIIVAYFGHMKQLINKLEILLESDI
jgi:hypothetical protein